MLYLKNGREMEKIDLFDKYIKGELSDNERIEFDDKLSSDNEFATEFSVYCAIVRGVCQEAEQDNLDFGIAMKNITKEQLREIIGPRHVVETPNADNKPKAKIINMRAWMWQAISIAAVVVIAFTAVFRIQQQAEYAVDNAIYTCNAEEISQWRSGAVQIDINKLSEDQLREKLPQLINMYTTAIDEQEIADNGYSLAMAYIRLHEREEAKKILTQLIERFDGNEDFQGYVTKCKSVLDMIK